MFAWQKKLTKEISFTKSLIIILIFFLISVIIIYYTTISSQAVVTNYSNLIITQSNLLSDEDNSILITRPRPDEYVGNHFFIAGRINLNTEKIYYRVINEDKEVILRGNIIINKQNILTEVNLDENNLTPKGTIEFYYNNIEEDKRLLILPVKFL